MEDTIKQSSRNLLLCLREDGREAKVANLQRFGEDEWREVVSEAGRHQLMSMLFWEVKQLSPEIVIPEDLHERLHQYSLQVALGNMKSYSELKLLRDLQTPLELPNGQIERKKTMKNIHPQQPSHLSPYALSGLNALVQAGLADTISLGGALGLFHYLDYRPTYDVDAWWSESATEVQRRAVLWALETTLSAFGSVRVRAWGDVVSVELAKEGKTVFSFQIAARSVRLEETVSAGWIDIRLDSLEDLVSAKMNALIERGAPRDFLDIFTICDSRLFNIAECWALWRRRQTLAGSDADMDRARLAIETHLERIALHRPLDEIENAQERAQAQKVRDWFLSEFGQVEDE